MKSYGGPVLGKLLAVFSWGSDLILWLFFLSFRGGFCGGSVCGLGGSAYCLGMERKVCNKPLCNNSGILRQHLCGALRGEYVKTSAYIYLVFLCIYRLPRSVFLVGVSPVGIALRVSLSLCTVIWYCHWLVV